MKPAGSLLGFLTGVYLILPTTNQWKELIMSRSALRASEFSATFYDVVVEVQQTRDATIATAYRNKHTGHGTAKRMPGDPFDPVIGEDLALSRALHELADNLEARARSRMPD